MSKRETTANQAWQKLIEKYNIFNKIEKYGTVVIKASQIKEFREPRLMAKWDSSEVLPKIFKDNKINILPISRSAYVLGNFNLYQPIGEFLGQHQKIKYMNMPPLESIDAENINSEAIALNVMLISGILNDFLSVEKNIATFNGRMGTGDFKFYVDGFRGEKNNIFVSNAQCEIDGGFENDESVVILEAKNITYTDFNIRQLYYPYRLWSERVKKPIRLIFSLYSNLIFHLFEYRFVEKNNYSSIVLLNQKNYSLQDTEINMEDIKNIRLHTEIKTDDDQDKTDIPFVQADSMGRIISLLEKLYSNPMTRQQIAEFMNFEKRQADYYFSAGRYLGLFHKVQDEDDNNKTLVLLTSLGERIFKMPYKHRQLSLVKQILEHKIFMEFFDKAFECGEIAQINDIKKRMTELNVCKEAEIHRRASSVRSWLKWIFDLVENENV